MFIVVNIGCIECGVSSNIVGVFTNLENANSIAKGLNERLHWREGGQNSYEVFIMPEPNVIHKDYLDEKE